MDINNNNIKIYKFKFAMDDGFDYFLSKYPEIYEIYRNRTSGLANNHCVYDDFQNNMYEINRDNNSGPNNNRGSLLLSRLSNRPNNNSRPNNNGMINYKWRRTTQAGGFYSLHDINNNEKKLLDIFFYSNDFNSNTNDEFNYVCKYRCSSDPSNPSNDNFKYFTLPKIIPRDNIYLKDFFENVNSSKAFRSKLMENKIIHILINNFCKLHYIVDINISMQKIYHDHYCNSDGFNGSIFTPESRLYIEILDTMTFAIDETKESNNRNIKFYEKFSDFYRVKNNSKTYKIIQQSIGDSYCLIEELEPCNILIKDLMICDGMVKQSESHNTPIKKTYEDIIKDKDLEIEQLKNEIFELKKEILELKKFYL